MANRICYASDSLPAVSSKKATFWHLLPENERREGDTVVICHSGNRVNGTLEKTKSGEWVAVDNQIGEGWLV